MDIKKKKTFSLSVLRHSEACHRRTVTFARLYLTDKADVSFPRRKERKRKNRSTAHTLLRRCLCIANQCRCVTTPVSERKHPTVRTSQGSKARVTLKPCIRRLRKAEGKSTGLWVTGYKINEKINGSINRVEGPGGMSLWKR